MCATDVPRPNHNELEYRKEVFAIVMQLRQSGVSGTTASLTESADTFLKTGAFPD